MAELHWREKGREALAQAVERGRAGLAWWLRRNAGRRRSVHCFAGRRRIGRGGGGSGGAAGRLVLIGAARSATGFARRQSPLGVQAIHFSNGWIDRRDRAVASGAGDQL